MSSKLTPAPQAPSNQNATGAAFASASLRVTLVSLGLISIGVDRFECPAQPRRRPLPPLGFRANRLDRNARLPSVRPHVQACFPQGLPPRSGHGHFAHGRIRPFSITQSRGLGTAICTREINNQNRCILIPQHHRSIAFPHRPHRPRYRCDNPRGSPRRPYPPRRHAVRPADLG